MSDWCIGKCRLMIFASILLISPYVFAVDTTALQRSLLEFQRVMEKSERESTAREQQKRRLAEQQAAEAERKERQKTAEITQAINNEVMSLTPPEEFAGRLVFNIRQLERTKSDARLADFSVISTSSVAVSNDGHLLAYVNLSGQLVLRAPAGGPERIVRDGLKVKGVHIDVRFAGNKALLVKTSDFTKPGETSKLNELIDFRGVRLFAWEGEGYSIFPGDEGITVEESGFSSAHYCNGVAAYDFHGKLLQRLDFAGESFTYCSVSLFEGRFRVRATRKDKSEVYYLDGQQVSKSQFHGDEQIRKVVSEFQGQYGFEYHGKLLVFRGGKNELLQLNGSTFQLERTISLKLPDTHKGSVFFADLLKNGLFAVYYGYVDKEKFTQIYDLESGRLLQELPVALFGGKHIVTKETSRQSDRIFTAGWFLVTAPFPDITEFLLALKKDKYESSAEYQARVAKLSQPFVMDVNVSDYHADGAHYSGVWRGVRIGVPMPAAQARKLDGINRFSVRGELSVIDENLVELRNASITLPDGAIVRIPQSKSAVAGAATPQVAPVMPVTPAALSKPSVKQAVKSANCSGNFNYLAPQFRPYMSKELAEARNAFLSASVTSVLEDVRKKGITIELLNRQAAEFDRTAEEAAQTADQTDGGVNSIQQVKNGTLSLQWQCKGIHGTAVCAYILNKWDAQITREAANLMSRCN